MEVFLVVGTYNYEGSEVEGVFSSLEKAKDMAEETRSQGYDHIYIEKWEVDGKFITYVEHFMP